MVIRVEIVAIKSLIIQRNIDQADKPGVQIKGEADDLQNRSRVHMVPTLDAEKGLQSCYPFLSCLFLHLSHTLALPLLRQQSLDDLQNYPNSNSAPKRLGKSLREHRLTNSYSGLNSKYLEEDDFEDDDSSAANSELFHGFLTIGTFGSDPLVTDPTSTPTFSISVENIAEKETEVTEDELKLINDELEKVLGNEEDESLERNSNASAITLAGKILEAIDTNMNGTMICPLQDYLFGSTIDTTKTTLVRKEHRPSLGELFQREKVEDENRDNKNERRKNKGKDKSAIRILKNILKKTMVHAPSATDKKVESDSKKKLNKILRVFHRKVYPEGSMSPPKSDKPSNNEMEKNIKYNKRGKWRDNISLEEDTVIFPLKFKSHHNLSEAIVSGEDYDGNREFWIKTDSDYLVLEL